MALPAPLQAAIEHEVESIERPRVARAAQQITSDYKAEIFSTSLASAEARAAYLVTRLPATFAANHFVLREIQRLDPESHPKSILDLGAGPGTATWAALEVWPSITNATLVESNCAMLETGRRLASAHDVLSKAKWLHQDLRSASFPRADLVVLSYSVGELATDQSPISKAWSSAQQMLVIVEPGTPRNFARVAQVRGDLISMGGHIVAPCPHSDECPMWLANDWCHFGVRLERTSAHRQMKGGALGYEDEKFSYVVFSKRPVQHAETRIVRHPLIHSGHIQLTLCGPDGLTKRTVTRSNKEAFRAAKKAKWGDEWNQLE